MNEGRGQDLVSCLLGLENRPRLGCQEAERNPRAMGLCQEATMGLQALEALLVP